MAFASPPPAPQRGDRTTFSSRVDAFLTWLVNLIPQLNVFLSSITSLAAGGANTFVYAFDSGTADSDPGAGRLRVSSFYQNQSTVIRLNTGSGGGTDMSPFLSSVSAGTSNIKASIRLQKVGDVSSFLLFDITAITGSTGFYNLTVVPRASSGASPFAGNDTLAVFFDPKGDRGDGGNTPTQAEMLAAVGTLQINRGGTGQVSAAAALAALGGLPATGGDITGNVTFNNNTGLFWRDSNGTSHQVLVFAGDNNTYLNMGPGGFLRIQNADGSATIVAINNGGNITPAGGITLPNNVPLYMANANGAVRPVSNLDPSNWLNYYGGLSGTRWYNSIGSAQLATLSDSGAFTALTVTATSDERKKTNWRALTDAQLDALADLDKVGVFDWIDGSGASVGGSAQQIQRIVPEAVHADADGSLSVNYGGLCFAMAHGALRRASAK